MQSKAENVIMKCPNLKYIFFAAMVTLTQKVQACFWNQDMSYLGIVTLTSNATVALPITVTRTTGTGDIPHCGFFIYLDYGGAATPAARTLKSGTTNTFPIAIRTQSGNSANTYWENFVDAGTNNNNRLAGRFLNSEQSITVNYCATLNNSTVQRAGTHTNTFNIRFDRSSFGVDDGTTYKTGSITFQYVVPTVLDLSLVDTSSAFNAADTDQTMNFGTLTTGATRSFDIVMQYNVGYRLSMKSDNSGNLKASGAAIPYSMTLNGAPINLSNAMQEKANSGSAYAAMISPTGGTRLPVSVTIGNVNGKPGGTYSDTVSISVSAY